MADLFQTTKQNISLHIQNIYEEGELVPEATVKKYLTVRQEGNNEFPDIDCSIPSGAFDTHTDMDSLYRNVKVVVSFDGTIVINYKLCH